MSNARFWFVPLKDVAPADEREQLAARDEVRASDLPPDYAVPTKLYQEGIRAGHVLALHDGDNVTALARVLAIDSAASLHWRRLPVLDCPQLSAAPELREVTPTEAEQFKVGIAAILRDVPASTGPTAAPSAAGKTYTPAKPASNIILYGPPGTGKTHSSRRRALELIGDATAAKAPLSEVKAEWDRLRHDGQIVFCTFHQAFAYEEFVEGLRAMTDEDGNVDYRVEPGVFKRLAQAAAAEGISVDDSSDGDFDDLWESLVERLRAEPRVVESARKMKYQLDAAARGGILVRAGTVDDEEIFEPNGKSLIASENSMRLLWENRAQLGDSPKTTEIGPLAKGHGTAMWMVYRELIKLQKSNPGSADPVARARRAFASERSFNFAADCRQYVLVIDEINRANIARVFGELITLLEPDKRLGSLNELRVQLPASKEWFGVPPNLHVLGTMNTADRSIALMDVALRRRFTFEEMMPDLGELSRQLEKTIADEAIRALILAVFKKMNERLRFLYDREHQIGHAYFFEVKDLVGLREVFATKIIPLLQEYFYGNWGKVALVLGHPHKKDSPVIRKPEDHTILTVKKVSGKQVLGAKEDDYEDQFAWELSPAFLPRGSFAGWTPQEIEQVFQEVAGPGGS